MKTVFALALIGLGFADIFLKTLGIPLLDLALIGTGLFIIGFSIFASLFKVLVFVFLMGIFIIGTLIGFDVLTLDELSIYYEKSTTYVKERVGEDGE